MRKIDRSVKNWYKFLALNSYIKWRWKLILVFKKKFEDFGIFKEFKTFNSYL
jgi:hypothetical protein